MKVKIKTLKRIGYSLILLAALLLLVYFYYNSYYPYKLYLNEQGYLTYKPSLKKVEFTRALVEENAEYKKEKIVFVSKDANVYAHLYLPQSRATSPATLSSANKFNALVFLPAAQKTKEDTAERGKAFARLGYASLILDVRGVGDTAGILTGIEQDYQLFASGKEPVYYLNIYDALIAAKLLKQLPEINNLVYAGESLGGRTAIIAGAIYDKQDARIKGVLGVSTAGYGAQQTLDYDAQRYLNSIDPDIYVSKITPRKTYFIHANKDVTIPIAAGKDTFNKASEPKKMFVVNNTCHGYCKDMDEAFADALKGLFE